MTVRVVVADDHPLVRDGLRALLSSTPGMELVGEAATGREAVRAAVVDRPDVLIMDIRMPDLDGVAATSEIARTAPDVAVLVLTMFEDDDSVFAAINAGARGYLVKGATQAEITRAISAAAAGEAIFGRDVARRLLGHLTRAPQPPPPAFPQLTSREREILELVALGQPNAAIASRLGLSGKTIANHVSSIFTKLQVTGRAEAIIKARDAGLGRA
jgi:DNA-binding NarL/FixJ family response regulator